MNVLYIFIAFAALTQVIRVAARRYSQQRIGLAEQMAAQYGFRVDTTSKQPPPQQFDLFTSGSQRRLSFQFWREGEQDSVFQYEYTTGSNDNEHTHRQTCALIALPFSAPHTTIGAENFFGGIGRALGIRDIEVESVEFNDEFRVRSDDDRFAIALLDQPMIAWMLTGESGRGDIRFELWGSWLLCVSKTLDMSAMFGFLDWSQGVRTHMPVVLSSLYPIR